MKCPNCSTQNPEAAKFCLECGCRLETASSQPDEEFAHLFQDDALSKNKHRTSDDLHNSADSCSTPTVAIPRMETAQHNREAAQIASNAADKVTVANALPLRAESPNPIDLTPPETPHPYCLVDIPECIDNSLDFSSPELEQTYTPQTSSASAWNPSKTMEMPALQGEELQDFGMHTNFVAPDKEQDTKKPHMSRKRKIALLVVALVVVLVGSIAGITYYMELWGGISVPDVVGLSETEAKTLLQQKGFSVRAMKVPSDDTEGKVVLTDPATNNRARKGGEVVIHVATPRTVPDIVGKTQAEAEALLKEAGYTNVSFKKTKTDDEEDKVLTVSPEAGTKVKGATPITVEVSESYKVPDVSGMEESLALAAVLDAGFTPQVVYVNVENVQDGYVVSTSPEAETKLPSSSVVVVNVMKARASELIDLVQTILCEGAQVTIGGTNYLVHSLESANYVGDDVVEFSIVGQAYAVLDGEIVYGSTRTIQGSAAFDSSNNYSLY